jgi:hypothetical protein
MSLTVDRLDAASPDAVLARLAGICPHPRWIAREARQAMLCLGRGGCGIAHNPLQTISDDEAALAPRALPHLLEHPAGEPQ